MSVLTLVCAALFVTAGADPVKADAPTKAANLAEYKALKAKAGNGADEHVRLALWCEAHDLGPERVRHLAKAMIIDPGNTLARGLAGLIQFRGRWMSPEAVDEAARGDQHEVKLLAEYNSRRTPIDQRAADDDAKVEDLKRQGKAAQAYSLRSRSRRAIAKKRLELGLWCEKAGLKGEAEAEFVTATDLDPQLDLAWKHLGFVRLNGRWVSADRLAADRAEAKAQAEANARWEASLKKWRSWLRDKARRDEAVDQLTKMADPRAVPAICRVFMDDSADHQQWAVKLLDQIRTPESSRALATMAVFSGLDDIREKAIQILKRRPPSEYLGMLVDMIRTPASYATTNATLAPGTQGALVVNTARYQLQISYDAPAPVHLDETFRGYAGYDFNGLPLIAGGSELSPIMTNLASKNPTDVARGRVDILFLEARTAELMKAARLKSQAAQLRMASDIQAVERSNAQTLMVNGRVQAILMETADAPPDLKDNEDAWNRWRYDREGYDYKPPEVMYVYQEVPSIPPPVLMSCFAAGTPVRTLHGPRPIESIRPGDRVLSQDTTSGMLEFQPVTGIHHNPPIKTVRLTLDNGDSIMPSIYHRFWIAGKGWALARDLKPGDVLRSLQGTPTITAFESGETIPVFNLDVARHHTYYVGDHEALVHDNTPPDVVSKPFDAMPDWKGSSELVKAAAAGE
jgi:hypothetical protein